MQGHEESLDPIPQPAGTPRLFEADAKVEKRDGAMLPHWSQDDSTYFITFRLADSIPQELWIEWTRDMKALERRLRLKELAPVDFLRAKRMLHRQLHRWLDEGRGECLMRNPQIAKVVHDALLHFDLERYQLWAWSVMPNHVHVVVEPLQEWKMDRILHAWKSFTAHEINQVLHRRGIVWQQESFDHLIRTDRSFEWCVEYTYGNAVSAGLRAWPWQGKREYTWKV